MFGFRSDKSAEDSGRPGADICHGYLSLDSVLETKLQQFCQPLLQGLEDRPKSRTWQLERSLATPMGPGRLTVRCHKQTSFYNKVCCISQLMVML